MVTSPCKSCALLGEDKNNDTCMNCDKRLTYIRMLGDSTKSIPTELTDMATSSNNNGRRRRYSMEEKQYLFRNYKEKTNSEMAKELGRSIGSVAGMLSHSGLIRPKEKLSENESKYLATIKNHPINFDLGAGLQEVLPKTKDFIIIDFSGRDELFKSVIEAASDNFRTPELQILFYCHQAINGQSIK